MKSAYDIIIKPVLTEKSYADMADKKFTFEVDVRANKTEIKQALESIFEGVKVESVNTMRTIGKIKRQGVHSGRTPEIKKAYVEKWCSTRKPLDYLQFQRIGYYTPDYTSTPDHLVFNKTVGLKDTWKPANA